MMRTKFFLPLFFLLFSVFWGIGQSCLPEGITFSTQGQIDSFAINYPGCVEIEGDVLIGDNTYPFTDSGISDLSGLAQLEIIAGKLSIQYNDSLSTLEGLDNISTIKNSLEIANNGALVSLTGMENLIAIAPDINLYSFGSLIIKNNPGLVDFSGFENLQSIGRNIEIANNNAITDLSGFENLTSLNGYISIHGNEALSSLYGIDNIDPSSVKGSSLEIYQNPMLSLCSSSIICDVIISIDSWYPIDSWNLNIHSNATGCDNLQEILENCESDPEGVMYFTSQEKIDNFESDFPQTTDIPGEVWIKESVSSNIKSLNGLSQLTDIGGNFHISLNDSLINLEGLNNLGSVDGDLTITYNVRLSDLSALLMLAHTGSSIHIRKNPNLASLHGFEGITGINNDLLIWDNGLISVEGFNNLDTIGASLLIQGNYNLSNLTGLDNLTYIGENLTVQWNTSLISFAGLETLEHVGESFEVIFNTNLLSLGEMSNLNYIGKDIYLEGNTNLNNIQAFSNIDTITHDLRILKSTQLDDLSGFGNLVRVGFLEITYTPITNLAGLSNLNSVDRIRIFQNPNMKSIAGLENIEYVEGDINITNNINFLSLHGLENLTHIEGSLIIRGNDILTNLSGLENIETINDILFIQNNASLADLSVLENITSLNRLHIEKLPALNNLSGLENITTIRNGLSIKENAGLTNLDELQQLTLMGHLLAITDNPSLTSISGIENINPDSIDFTQDFTLEIHGNNLLNQCNLSIICAILSQPSVYDAIYENAPGCNSAPEIEAACLNPTNTPAAVADFIIYPNPASGSFYISSFEDSPIEKILIFNQLGQLVLETKKSIVDISKLPVGMYILNVEMEGKSAVRKLIIER